MSDVQETPDELQRLRDENATLAATLRKQQEAAWKAEALKQFGLAEPFADLVNGDSQEGILAAAKSIHERLEKQVQAAVEKSKPEVQRAAAREAYGSGAAGGGGRPVDTQHPLAEIERKLIDGAETTLKEREKYLLEGGTLMMKRALGYPDK